MVRGLSETEFRALVRSLIAQGTHPDNATITGAMGRSGASFRSGLTAQQTRWRIDEMERSGYDWTASKAAGRLIRPTPPKRGG